MAQLQSVTSCGVASRSGFAGCFGCQQLLPDIWAFVGRSCLTKVEEIAWSIMTLRRWASNFALADALIDSGRRLPMRLGITLCPTNVSA